VEFGGRWDIVCRSGRSAPSAAQHRFRQSELQIGLGSPDAFWKRLIVDIRDGKPGRRLSG
jgi:hypothetical protein